jgi:drug/metabolite transporter (DMT)-like permease
VTAGSGGESETRGIFLAVLSVLFWGLASVFMRKLTAKYPAILVTTYGMMISLLLHVPVGLVSYLRADSIRIRPVTVIVLLYLGLVGSGLAQYTWTSVLAVLPASLCSLFYPLHPIFSSVLGFFLLGERLTGYFAVGLLFISMDVVLSTIEAMKNA